MSTLRAAVCSALMYSLSPALAETSSAADQERLAAYKGERLYNLNSDQLADYLALQASDTARTQIPPASLVARYARQLLDQPYRKFAARDRMASGDCITYVEVGVALSLASDSASLTTLRNRIRHKDGNVEYTNRNFFTLQDWVPNNAWILEDVTAQIGQSVSPAALQAFIAVKRPKRFGPLNADGVSVFLGADYSSSQKEQMPYQFLPRDRVRDVMTGFADGDVCLIIRRYENPALRDPVWYDCDHMGLIVSRDDGDPMLLHCAPPKARAEHVLDFLEKYRFVAGFMVLRLRAEARTIVASELSANTTPAVAK